MSGSRRKPDRGHRHVTDAKGGDLIHLQRVILSPDGCSFTLVSHVDDSRKAHGPYESWAEALAAARQLAPDAPIMREKPHGDETPDWLRGDPA